MQQGSRCPNCGSGIRYGQVFCSSCGMSIITSCPYCRTALNHGTRNCPTCGAPVYTSVTPQVNPNYNSPWNIRQQPGWGTQQPGSWQQAGWNSNTLIRQLTSTRSLLLIVLLFLILGLIGVVIWQFGSKPDKSLPIISNVSVAYRGKTGAQIIWQTDKPCSSQVEYGRTAPQYGSIEPLAPQNDPTTVKGGGVTSHVINLTNLRAGYTYHYRVRSKDASGNETISGDFSFKTDEAAPFVMPD